MLRRRTVSEYPSAPPKLVQAIFNRQYGHKQAHRNRALTAGYHHDQKKVCNNFLLLNLMYIHTVVVVSVSTFMLEVEYIIPFSFKG